jgi:hypothetical protein
VARPTDETGIAAPHRRRTIPTAPRPPSGHPRTPVNNTQTRTPSTTGTGGGGGGAPKNPYAAAQARADAAQAKADRASSKRWLSQAATMQQQIDALRVALGGKGLRRALGIQLANIRIAENQADSVLVKGYRERVGSLKDVAVDNEKAASGQSNANLQNRAWERANALSEAALQGAGETDVLRAQGASLRNWNANQNEVNRSFYDTLTSVNSSLTDLTVDTRTARVNAANDANANRNQVWTDYYGNRSEVLTNLGNALGQQAEYYGLANEAVSSKKVQRRQRLASRRYGNYIERASRTSGMGWRSPGVKKALRNWQGADEFEGDLNQEERFNTQTEIAPKKPEGASLREWAK